MSSNYPDDVTASMVPGNRPQDSRYEKLLEDFWNDIMPAIETAYGGTIPSRAAGDMAEAWAESKMDEDAEGDDDDGC